MVQLGNNTLTEGRQRLTRETRGRRARGIYPLGQRLAAAARRLDASGPSPCPAQPGFDLNDPTGRLHAACNVKEQLRALLRTGSLSDASAAKAGLMELVEITAQPNRFWSTGCRWLKENEVLIVSGATTAKV